MSKTAISIFHPESLHHAYICEGDCGAIYPYLRDFVERELGFATKANADFVYEEWDKFLISHARRLQEMQLNKTTDRGRKIFIVAFNFITREAQNALLKVLEEPTEGTHFFFITPSAHVFLDTILSRVQVVSHFKASAADEVGEKFLKASLGKRMQMAAKLADEIKDEKATKADALRLVRNVIRLRYEEIMKNFAGKTATSKKDVANELFALREAEKIADYLYDNSASTKTLLEHLALTV